MVFDVVLFCCIYGIILQYCVFIEVRNIVRNRFNGFNNVGWYGCYQGVWYLFVVMKRVVFFVKFGIVFDFVVFYVWFYVCLVFDVVQEFVGLVCVVFRC